MKVLVGETRPIDGKPDWLCLGIVEDAGEWYAMVRWLKAPMTEQDPKNPNYGKQMVLNGQKVYTQKDYIERVVKRPDLESSRIHFDLEYIETDTPEKEAWFAELQKFFMDNIVWRSILEANKRAIDDAMKRNE